MDVDRRHELDNLCSLAMLSRGAPALDRDAAMHLVVELDDRVLLAARSMSAGVTAGRYLVVDDPRGLSESGPSAR